MPIRGDVGRVKCPLRKILKCDAPEKTIDQRGYIKMYLSGKTFPTFETNLMHKPLLKILGYIDHDWFRDTKSYATTMNDLRDFLWKDTTDVMQYVPEFRDCDDFSSRLKTAYDMWVGGSNNLGEIILYPTTKTRHAQNIFFDLNSGFFYLVEPQEDGISRWNIEPIYAVEYPVKCRW